MRKIETRSQIVEALNRIDHKCIDNNLHFHDLRSLFEATEDRLTAQDKNVLRTLLNNSNVEAEDIKAVMDARLEEDTLPDGSYYDPEDYEGGYTEWDLIEKKDVMDSDGFWTEYTLWHNEFNDQWVCIFGDSDIYYPENSDYDAEFEDEDEAREWFDSYEGFDNDLDERLLIFGNKDKDRENKLIVTLHTGTAIDGFIATVIKDGEQVFNQKYEYGRNASYSKLWSEKSNPYISGILRALCDEYSIPKSNIEVVEGDDVFKESGISKRKIQEFTNKYVTPIMNESLEGVIDTK